MGLMDKIDVNALGDVAKEVEKSVDVKKVADSAVKDGKLDLKGAAQTVQKEVTADEAKNIANAAKKVVK